MTYHLFAVKYGSMFRASIGAEALYTILKKIDLKAIVDEALVKSPTVEACIVLERTGSSPTMKPS